MKCYINLTGVNLTVTIESDDFNIDNEEYKENFEKKKVFFNYIKNYLNLDYLKIFGTYVKEEDFFYITNAEDKEGNNISLDGLPSLKYRTIHREDMYCVDYDPINVLVLDKYVRENCPVFYQIKHLFNSRSNIKNDGIVVVDGKEEYNPLDVPLNKVLSDTFLEKIYKDTVPSSSTEFYNSVKDKLDGYNFKLTEIKKLTNKFYKRVNNLEGKDKRKK